MTEETTVSDPYPKIDTAFEWVECKTDAPCSRGVLGWKPHDHWLQVARGDNRE